MKKALKIAAVVVAVIVLVVFAGGLLLPRHWEVSRSRQISAPAPAIHAYVGDLARWPVWSPFEKEDSDNQER